MYWIPFLTVRILFERRAVLIAENLALRQQLAVLRRSVKRPRAKTRDRIFWALMSQLWSGWRSALIIVQPATVVGWHRQGNVTESPSADWTALQIKQAVAFSEPCHGPRYLLRDRDGIYGSAFSHAAETLGIEEVLSAARSPWQNPFCERVIGSIRRECLDHVIILGEEHLRRILRSYFAYYHESRTHLSLDKAVPRVEHDPGARGPVAKQWLGV